MIKRYVRRLSKLASQLDKVVVLDGSALAKAVDHVLLEAEAHTQHLSQLKGIKRAQATV